MPRKTRRKVDVSLGRRSRWRALREQAAVADLAQVPVALPEADQLGVPVHELWPYWFDADGSVRPGAYPNNRENEPTQPQKRRVHECLAGGMIECLDRRAFLDRYDRPATLFYLDPPTGARRRTTARACSSRATSSRSSRGRDGVSGQ